MREIEFRAKVKWSGNHFHAGEWEYGTYFYDGEHKLKVPVWHPLLENEILEYTEVEIDENTLGQYTGLKDVKGTKIFEGDTFTDSENYLYEMYYVANEYKAGFELCDVDNNETISLDEIDLLVIGNIHDKEG